MALTPIDEPSAATLREEVHQATVRRALRRQRRRRTFTALNAGTAVLLAVALFVMLNYAAARHAAWRRDVSSLRFYQLSDKTRSLLRDVHGRVHLVAVFRGDNPLGDDVRRLLEEYAAAGHRVRGMQLTVEHVDPDRDLARTRELAARYEVTEPDVIVVVVDDRHMVLTDNDLVDYARLIDPSDIGAGQLRVEKKKRGFLGEQVISSAIHTLAQTRRPVVYMVTGHGERQPDDFSAPAGYAGAVRLLRRENTEVRPLLLAEAGAVPADADAVIIAGPTVRLADSEVALLSAYLERSGRVLFLLDPGPATGLESLLETWGVRLDRDVVKGLTLTGRELIVREYGRHPVTRALHGVITMFYQARSVEVLAPAEGAEASAADRPRATALAVTAEGKASWAERNLTQDPPRFDPEVDRKGPISVAVAVERGSPAGIEMELPPTRVVVIGDSDFVANAALKSGAGGNADFLLGVVNWLVAREDLLEIAAKSPIDLRLDMDNRQARMALLAMVLGLPGCVALIGVLVWLVRRR